MNAEIFPLLLDKFPPKEQLPLRLVCNDWNKLVGESPSLHGVILTLDKRADPSEGLRSLSGTLKLKHFCFKNVDLEGGNFLGDPQLRRSFFTGACPKLESIYLMNCNLSSERFMELISQCPNLSDLRIQKCPSLYQINLAALHWGICFKSLTRNLGGLKVLKLAEILIPEKDLWGLTGGMGLLEEVVIGVNEALLPRRAIFKLMKANCATLKDLTLMGRLLPQNIVISDFEEMDLPPMSALTSLKLSRAQFKSAVKHSITLERLLKACPMLRELKISHSKLKPETLSTVSNSLTRLELGDCHFTTNNFGRLRLSQLQTLRIIYEEIEEYPNPSKTEGAILELLRVKMPELETLELGLVTGGKDCLKPFMASSRFSKLRSLSLSGLTEFERTALGRLFKEFSDLEVLELTNSPNLVDECLCSRGWDHEASLANLTNLRTLNLSHTMISNPTIDECLNMSKLEWLQLEHTQVNREGLKQIVTFLECGLLPSLYVVDLAGSPCHVGEEELEIMIAPFIPRMVHVNL